MPHQSKIAFAALVALAAAVIPAEVHATPLSSGLLGYWQFNGNGVDSTGNGNTLSLFGGAGFGPGLFGQALTLDGVQGSYAQQTTNNPAFDLGSADFAIQVWANPSSLTNVNGNSGVLIEKFSGASGPGWTFYITASGFQFYANGTLIASGTTSISTNKWNDFFVERSGNSFDLYFDGSLVAAGSFAGSIGGSSNPLLIGARDAADGRNFTLDGSVDETAIWDRALSPADIAALWNGGAGMTIPLVTTVAEPSTWLLLLIALGAAGFAARRRRSCLAA